MSVDNFLGDHNHHCHHHRSHHHRSHHHHHHHHHILKGLHQPNGCWRDWSWQLSQELPNHLSSRQLCFNDQLHLHLHFQANSRDLYFCDKVMHPMLPNRQPHWQPPRRQMKKQ